MGTLDGKTVLVTGATSGIGRAVAVGLARQGASVVLLARDEARGRDALALVQEAARAPSELLLADVSSLASVRRATQDFLDRHRQLHVLVNAASVFLFKRQTSPDGLELMFATNHLGPFLLTWLLLDALKAGAPSRVLTITAPSTVPLDFDDLQGEKKFVSSQAFGASKAANLLFTFALARRLKGSGITANAIHPGLVRSGLMRHAPAPIRWVTYLASAPPERAVAPIVRVATEPEFATESGGFFLRGRAIDPPPYTRDVSVQERLWAASAALAGLPE
jgi:NAD(P)-dependent dehydrogenase (short-subunit alcohol dehydrogenase family)